MRKFKQFFENEAAGGIVLIITAVFALVVANLPITAHLYEELVHFPVAFSLGHHVGFNLSFEHFVNDALMAIFFLSVAIEIKHETLHGHLSSFKQASFPLFGAVGGMIVPAVIFSIFNLSNAHSIQGWAIPTATDIAFAIGVLSLMGNLVPPAVKVFLLALAVIDDLGAIIVIALFYTSEIHASMLFYGLVAIAVMLVLNRLNVRALTPYLLLFVVAWYGFLQSGVHATIAGVLAGFVIPNRDIHGRNLSADLEHYLAPYIKWLIIPVFAFVNSGVAIGSIGSGLADNLTLIIGITLGLVVGKPVGIYTCTLIATWLKLTEKPVSMDWTVLFYVGIICGIGFTMSIFITNLSFTGGTEADQVSISIARLSILVGSTIAAVLGLILTKRALIKSQSRSKYRVKQEVAKEANSL